MKQKLLLLITLAWVFLSLFVTAELHAEVFYHLIELQAALLWVPLVSAPLVPLLWLWLFEKSPWNRIFIVGILVAGSGCSLLALNDRKADDWFILPVMWSAVALLNAYILRRFRNIGSVFIRNISHQVSEGVSIGKNATRIDHIKFLRQLDEQITIGLPSVMRVQCHFLEKLPKIMVALRPHQGAEIGMDKFPADSPFTNQQIKNYMTQKLSTELTYICTIAFLDRVCGPDFRFTKQYKRVCEFFLDIKTSEDALPATEFREELKIDTILVQSDLDAALKSLDNETAKRSEGISATNLTVSFAGLHHVILSGLEIKEKTQGEEIVKIVYAGMAQTRSMFLNQSTTV